MKRGRARGSCPRWYSIAQPTGQPGGRSGNLRRNLGEMTALKGEVQGTFGKEHMDAGCVL